VSVGAAVVKAVAATRAKMESLENMLEVWCRWEEDVELVVGFEY
jgi:hypothetical protein